MPIIKQLGVEAAGKSAIFSSDSMGRTPSDMGWQTFTWSFTAVSGTTTLEFRSLDSVGGFAGPALTM